jgi:bifunctional DNA-binding transcriptional regulator/antitoxin component of YhaV-PrlF toxin-antitoxin module
MSNGEVLLPLGDGARLLRPFRGNVSPVESRFGAQGRHGADSSPYPDIDICSVMEYNIIMESTVTTKNMTSIPVAVARKTGIRPGWKLEWILGDKPDELTVRVIPDRTEMANRLFGKGENLARGRDVLADLIREREEE